MKKNDKLTALGIVVVLMAATISIAAQTQDDQQKARPRTTATAQKPAGNTDRLEPDDTSRPPSDVSDDITANRKEQMSEAAAVDPYYNNFFSTYKLGPEDVISIEVFNQPRYSRSGVTVPPSGRVSLALIPGGVFVNGKTVDEVAEVIKKKYDEFIIDPQVTVSIDKAGSYRYSIIGDIAQPGVRLMSHRMTVTEAIAEAGGVLGTGDKSKVTVLRRGQGGVLTQIPVNVSAVYKGKAADTTYLVPGDQIIVPGNKLKKVQQILAFSNVLNFARIFGLGGF
jgi:protein involved in polysaccharide export with SLBB domain